MAERSATLMMYADAKFDQRYLEIRTTGDDQYFDEALKQLVKVRYPSAERVTLTRADGPNVVIDFGFT